MKKTLVAVLILFNIYIVSAKDLNLKDFSFRFNFFKEMVKLNLDKNETKQLARINLEFEIMLVNIFFDLYAVENDILDFKEFYHRRFGFSYALMKNRSMKFDIGYENDKFFFKYDDVNFINSNNMIFIKAAMISRFFEIGTKLSYTFYGDEKSSKYQSYYSETNLQRVKLGYKYEKYSGLKNDYDLELFGPYFKIVF